MNSGWKIIGATLHWDGRPAICFEKDGKRGFVLPRNVEAIVYAAYYDNDHPGGFPCDPKTGEPLAIWEL